MYTTIRRYEGIDPSRVDELMQRVEQGFVPIVGQVPGFVGYYVIDAGGGVIASVSVFEDQAGADESVQRAANWVQSMTDLIPNPPQITAGEVRISEEQRMRRGGC
jgi:hypothetical protein